MRIAYIDHSYHIKTKSTGFLPELLREQGNEVDVFWDDTWQGGAGVDWASVAAYDGIVMFQSTIPIEAPCYGDLHNNVTYIPMLDQFGLWRAGGANLAEFWKKFEGCKILNFSQSLHYIASSWGFTSHFAQFFRDPAEFTFSERSNGQNSSASDAPSGFFWLRRPVDISWESIRSLLGESEFSSLHLHWCPDPGMPEVEYPNDEDRKRYKITTSTWFESKDEFYEKLASADIFFAPRAEEGIGQSFLEAMAMGKCVVSPDHGTMNEYITHGLNGLLYDLNRPDSLDFSSFHEMGGNARETIVKGYERWLGQKAGIAEFIEQPVSLQARSPDLLGKQVEGGSVTSLLKRGIRRIAEFPSRAVRR